MNFLYSHGLFGWLLRWFCPMFMFAAGSAALADGGADMSRPGDLGDGGDGGEGGDGGDQDLGDGGDGGDGTGDLDRGDGEGSQTPEQRRAAAQEARLGADAKKLLGDLKASNDPKQIKLAENIRRALFADQAWKQVMPGGIRQAREMRQAFDEVGGADGIRAIQEEKESLNQELESIDQAWEQADPQWISGLAEENPDAFAKIVPICLEELRKVDKNTYNFTTARIFNNTLQASGVAGMLTQLWNLAKSNHAAPGMAGILEGLEQVLGWANGIRELAMSEPTRTPDAGMKRLKEQQSQFEQRQATAFKQDVQQQNLRNLETSLTRHLGRFLKTKNVDFLKLKGRDPETFNAMLREAESRLTSALTKDRGFQQQKDRMLANRDRAGVTRLYQQKFEYLLADAAGPKIARAVGNIFFRGAVKSNAGGAGNNGGGRQNRQNGNRSSNQNNGGSGGGTEVRVSNRPDPGQIDYGRTTDQMIMDGKAYLKGQKNIVRWRDSF